MNLVWVTEAHYVRDYIIDLSFNDGTICSIDFSKILDMRRKIFTPLLDQDVFKEFSLDGWTLTWQNGTIDIAPEFLYEAAISQAG